VYFGRRRGTNEHRSDSTVVDVNWQRRNFGNFPRLVDVNLRWRCTSHAWQKQYLKKCEVSSTHLKCLLKSLSNRSNKNSRDHISDTTTTPNVHVLLNNITYSFCCFWTEPGIQTHFGALWGKLNSHRCITHCKIYSKSIDVRRRYRRRRDNRMPLAPPTGGGQRHKNWK